MNLVIITEESPNILSNKGVVPSIDIFGFGHFQEIRIFVGMLQKKIKVDLYIISSKYGLISSNEKIESYEISVNTKYDAIAIGKKLKIYENFVSVTCKYDIIVIALSSKYLNMIFRPENGLNFLNDCTESQHIILVCAPSLFNKLVESAKNNSTKIHLYSRLGVSRISRENRENIIELIKTLLKKKRI